MKKREANFTLRFRSWIRANPMNSAAFELKQTQTNSFAYSDLKEHQVNALLAAKHKRILYKVTDDSLQAKPFDFFYLSSANAYVVIKYPLGFVMIDIDVFLNLKKIDTRKSLLWETAEKHATVRVKLKE